MRRKPCFRIFSALRAVLAGAFLFLLQSALPAAAVAQDPETPPLSPAAAQEPQPQPLPSIVTLDLQLPLTKTTKRVWTNDDLESSRTPMDQYLVDKEAREAADAAQASADAIASEKAMAELKTPATVEETQRAIQDTRQDINDQTDALDRLNKELASAPDVQKAGIQREIERHTTSVQTSQQELKALQDHVKQLNSKSSGANSADSGKQPSQ
jgi:MFS superfamily sulfate permease-like transporter